MWSNVHGLFMHAQSTCCYPLWHQGEDCLRFADFGLLYSKLAEALKVKSCAIEYLDLSHNRLSEQV
jgi:hypothetical protein